MTLTHVHLFSAKKEVLLGLALKSLLIVSICPGRTNLSHPLELTRHEGEAGGQLHQAPRGDRATACTLEHSPIGTADSTGADASRHWCQVVGDGEGGAAADLHGG